MKKPSYLLLIIALLVVLTIYFRTSSKNIANNYESNFIEEGIGTINFNYPEVILNTKDNIFEQSWLSTTAIENTGENFIDYTLSDNDFESKYSHDISKLQGKMAFLASKKEYTKALLSAENLNLVVFENIKDSIKYFDFNYEMLNGSLPKTYTDRTFIKNLSGLSYDPFLLPGNILRYDEKLDDYKIVSLTSYIKQGKQLKSEVISDGLLFKDYLKEGMSLNGSYIIGSFKASKESIIEVNLTDISKTYVPDSLINKSLLEKDIKEYKLKEKGNYYWVKTATLTIANGSTFNESKFSKKINSVYITVDGEVYRTMRTQKKDRIVTLDLISINDLIIN